MIDRWSKCSGNKGRSLGQGGEMPSNNSNICGFRL
jgi:hypothetical protein